MEQLQRLADEIAETYITQLIRETGSSFIEYNNVRGEVVKTFLASGLLDNAVNAAKSLLGAASYENEAYKMLVGLISFNGPNRTITELGIKVISLMNRKALSKNKPTLQ